MKARFVNIIVLGAPGAGKGTQAKLIAARYGVPRLSTRDLLRAAVASSSQLGKSIAAMLTQGDLVPDEIVNRLIEGRVQKADCARGAVFDGYPRTLAQGEALDDILANRKRKVDQVIEAYVADNALLGRIEARNVSGSSRADDNAVTPQARLVAYHKNLGALVMYYERQGKLVRIDGQASINDVAASMVAWLNNSDRHV